MSLATQIKTELNKLGLTPKKSLGQNFLINEGVYHKILAATETQRSDTVVEVGPGLGTLTKYLAETGANILAIEKDHGLVKFLQEKFANQKNVTMLEDDILKFTPENQRLKPETYKLVGNIPYYLTSFLLRTALESWPMPKLIVLMLQKEVAQRIVAKPPNMNLLAISVQYYTQPKIISYVSSGSFYPAPDVDSAIIKLTPKVGLQASKEEIKKFLQVAKIGFAEKRKQLGNNLSGGLKLPKNLVEEKLKSITIDPRRRAETLTLDEWQKITNIFFLQD